MNLIPIMSGFSGSNDNMELPPGFRFHPTDEELITHYLSPKIIDARFSAKAIGEVNLNKVEPWDLPWRAKMGEKEWYFFCLRESKYPSGLRTNRATVAGYWKATGKDKAILKGETLIGMKKTLVFYHGRAPRGEKTNWVIHEFRLEGMNTTHNLPRIAKDEWVICRVFKKRSGPINSGENSRPLTPPLMEKSQKTQTLDVPCFSKNVEDESPQNSEKKEDHRTPHLQSSSSSDFTPQNSFLSNQPMQFSDHPILKFLLGNKQGSEVGLMPCVDQELLMTSGAGVVDLDSFWNY